MDDSGSGSGGGDGGSGSGVGSEVRVAVVCEPVWVSLSTTWWCCRGGCCVVCCVVMISLGVCDHILEHCVSYSSRPSCHALCLMPC